MSETKTATNVVGIPGLAMCVPPGTAVQSVVTLLREWLDAAERGEIVSVLIAAVKAPGGTRTEWSGVGSMDACVAAVTVLKARVMAQYLLGED